MQRRVAVIAVALLTVTAGCSALPGSPDQPTPASSATGQTVAVGASGQVQTAPNRAIIQVAVTARADSVETVRQQLARNASRMRTALTEMGIDDDQIASTRYDIGRNHRAEERPTEPRFRGQHAFTLTLNETSRAGPVVVTAIQNGATNVDEVRFTVTPETRRTLRERALSNAVTNARGKAAVLASDMNLTLTDVRTVQTGEVSVEPTRQREVALAAGDGGAGGGVSTSFEGGKVTVTADVSVVFNATAA